MELTLGRDAVRRRLPPNAVYANGEWATDELVSRLASVPGDESSPADCEAHLRDMTNSVCNSMLFSQGWKNLGLGLEWVCRTCPSSGPGRGWHTTSLPTETEKKKKRKVNWLECFSVFFYCSCISVFRCELFNERLILISKASNAHKSIYTFEASDALVSCTSLPLNVTIM